MLVYIFLLDIFSDIHEPGPVEKCEKVVPKIHLSSEDVRRRKQVLFFIKEFPAEQFHFGGQIYTGQKIRRYELIM